LIVRLVDENDGGECGLSLDVAVGAAKHNFNTNYIYYLKMIKLILDLLIK
jgi:hypothetical protein